MKKKEEIGMVGVELEEGLKMHENYRRSIDQKPSHMNL